MSNARNLARLLPNASGQLPDAAMSSGSVLQVVSASGPSVDTTSTGEFTFVSATITPMSATSKILVIATASINYNASSNAWAYMSVNRNSAVYFSPNLGWGGPITSTMQATIPLTVIDSPATTSATTYNLYGAKGSGGTSSINLSVNGARIVLMEIAG